MAAGALSVAAVASGAAAADRARVLSVTIEPRAAGIAIVVKGDAALTASAQTTAGTIVIRLPGALLPADVPAYQSVSDPLVTSMTAQQTTVDPPAALLAFALRAPATAAIARSDDGRAVTITFAAANGAGIAVPASPPAAVPPLPAPPQRAPLPAAAPIAADGARIYPLRAIAPADAAATLRRAFPRASFDEAPETASLIVRAPTALQAQIAAAVSGLDVAPSAGGGVTTTIVSLRSALPSSGNAGGTSTPNDIASTLTAVLGTTWPDLRVVVPANTTMLALSGSPATIRAALDLLRQLDVPSTQVVLDTAVYEIDENAARNVGLQLPGAAISTTFSEITPGGSFATPSPKVGFQALSRTPISFSAQINLLISDGKGRVLANPRVTTVSGRVATIRAGDNIPFVQTNSSPIGGTISQTVLTFQTGVTLDITPVVETDGRVGVTLHPIVNTLTGITQQGVPLISSREAQTTVDLHDGETVVIGGLIQENTVSTVSKIPGLGDLPVVGGIFRNSSRTTNRSELIIVVTPHLVPAGAAPAIGAPPPALPAPKLAPPSGR